MRIRSHRRRSEFCVLVLLVLVSCSSRVWSQSAGSKERQSDGWKTDIESGVSIIGKVPEFAEVGPTQSFAVSPDGETLAFATNAGVKLWSLKKKKIIKSLETGSSYGVQFSPDGRYLAGFFYGEGAKLKVWDAVDWSELAALDLSDKNQPTSFPQGFAFFPNGKQIALFLNNKIAIWDIDSQQKTKEFNKTGYIRKIAFLNDGAQIVLPGGNVIDTESGGKSATIPELKRFNQAITSRGNHLAAAGWGQGVMLYDADKKEGCKLGPETDNKNFINVEFSDDGKYVAAATYGYYDPSGKQNNESQLIVWDVESRQEVQAIKLGTIYLQQFKFSADSRLVFYLRNGEFGVSKFEFLEKSTDSDVPSGLNGPVEALGFSPNEKSIVLGSAAGELVVFNAKTGVPEKRIENISGRPARFIGFSKDGKRFFSAADYQLLFLFDAEDDYKKIESLDIGITSKPSWIQQLAGMMGGTSQGRTVMMIADVRISDDDKKLLAIAVAPQTQLRLSSWSAKSGKSLIRKNLNYSRYRLANGPSAATWRPSYPESVSPDGTLFVVTRPDMVLVVDVESGDVVHELECTDPLDDCIFSPDSKQLFGISSSRFQVWDLTSTEMVHSTELAEIRRAVLSRDGKRLAILHGKSNSIKIYATDTWEEVMSRDSKEKLNSRLAFSDNGDRLALGLEDGRVEIWDLNELVKTE